MKEFQFPYDASTGTFTADGFQIKSTAVESFLFAYKEIFVDQEYRFESAKADPLIIDCGANIGLATLYFKKRFPHAEIVAFEPDDAAFACLSRNIEQNGLQGVTAHPCALAKTTGSLDIYFNPNKPGALTVSALAGRISSTSKTVRAEQLSSFIERDVDYLKLDIEGMELDVLTDLRDSGKITLIQQMAIEYHHHIDVERDGFSHLLRLLEEAGFGYQISARLKRPIEQKSFQDIMVYAYRKD